MTKNTKTPYTGCLSFHRQTNAIKLAALVLIFLLGFTPKTYAVLVTHEWQESHRGYSIELIPGTSGAGAQYVAAGTAYDNTNHPGQTGWHFMRLDANGNILNSRIVWGANQQYRVVDIAVQNANAYRITIQAINTFLSSSYVYVHGVDVNGNDLPAVNNYSIWISSTYAQYPSLYPTHSYCNGNDLYIVGYATNENEGDPRDSGGPLKYTSDKIGWIMKTTLAGTVTVTKYLWNTLSASNGTDYDMPLRISPYSRDNPFPLLVTGAINNGNGGSAIYIGKFNSNLTGTEAGVFVAPTGGFNPYPDFHSIDPDNRWGYYGVDARADIGNENDIIILTNSFDDAEELALGVLCTTCPGKTWGVTRIKDNLSTHASPVNSIRFKIRPYINEDPGPYKVNEWATQFLELHYNTISPGVPGDGDHIEVIGQKIASPNCGTLPPGSLAPSLTNINPFIALANVGDAAWLTTTGYTSLPGTIGGANVFLSSKGTNPLNLDYYTGSVPSGPNGSALEDITRLYTSASIERFYDDPAKLKPPVSLPAIIAPVGENPATTNNNLLTRFIGTGLLFSAYAEPQCQKTIQDCSQVDIRIAQNVGAFQSFFNIPIAIHTASGSLENNTYIPSIKSCNTGYYKSTTSISNVEHVDAVKLYPNPTATELNIELPGTLTSKDAFEFKLVEMTGKTVYTNDNPAVGQSVLKFTLPQLAPGVYFGIVNLNGKQFSHKVTIQ